MKHASISILTLVAGFVLTCTNAVAADLLKDFDTLGGNDVLYDKAKALNPDASISVVQKRIVPRKNRFEFSPEFASVIGGDSYNRTQNIGMNVHYHFTPQWSVGLKYNYAFNELRPEGENLINDTATTGKRIVPDIDYPKQQTLAVLNWYPIYGKMNLYDLGITHFDIYALVGGGMIDLRSRNTGTITAGGGIGLWWSQHLTTRAELRYQRYEAIRRDGQVAMNTTVLGVQVGYLL